MGGMLPSSYHLSFRREQSAVACADFEASGSGKTMLSQYRESVIMNTVETASRHGDWEEEGLLVSAGTFSSGTGSLELGFCSR